MPTTRNSTITAMPSRAEPLARRYRRHHERRGMKLVARPASA